MNEIIFSHAPGRMFVNNNNRCWKRNILLILIFLKRIWEVICHSCALVLINKLKICKTHRYESLLGAVWLWFQFFMVLGKDSILTGDRSMIASKSSNRWVTTGSCPKFWRVCLDVNVFDVKRSWCEHFLMWTFYNFSLTKFISLMIKIKLWELPHAAICISCHRSVCFQASE